METKRFRLLLFVSSHSLHPWSRRHPSMNWVSLTESKSLPIAHQVDLWELLKQIDSNKINDLNLSEKFRILQKISISNKHISGSPEWMSDVTSYLLCFYGVFWLSCQIEGLIRNDRIWILCGNSFDDKLLSLIMLFPLFFLRANIWDVFYFTKICLYLLILGGDSSVFSNDYRRNFEGFHCILLLTYIF